MYTQKFKKITNLNYIAQAKVSSSLCGSVVVVLPLLCQWFLNGFWEEGADKEAEKVWTFTHKVYVLAIR